MIIFSEMWECGSGCGWRTLLVNIISHDDSWSMDIAGGLF